MAVISVVVQVRERKGNCARSDMPQLKSNDLNPRTIQVIAMK